MALSFGTSILGARLALDDSGVVGTLARAKLGVTAFRGELHGAGGALRDAGGRMLDFAGKAAMLTGGVASLTFGIGQAAKEFVAFETGIAKIGTLLPAGADAMALYGQSVQDIALKFGLGSDQISEGFFQAISASIPAEQATKFMEVAARASVGGFTDMTTAVDGLTTVLNAYGLSADEAERVSDAFFLANKAGKTTFDELARTLGNVVPTGAAVNVTYRDIAAAIASVTKQGIRTAEVTTGLRQALAAVLKPSEQAAKRAEELGLDFSEAALKAKGFEHFLTELAAATRGNAGDLVTLLGSVEAANIVLSLTSQAGFRDFREALGQMTKTSGQTLEAFDVVSKTAGFKFAQLRAAMRSMAIGVGEAIVEAFVGSTQDITKQITAWIPRVKEAVRDFIQFIRNNLDRFVGILETYLIVKGLGLLDRFGQGSMRALGSLGGTLRLAPPGGGLGDAGPDGKPAASAKSAIGKVAGALSRVTLVAQTAYIAAEVGYLAGEGIGSLLDSFFDLSGRKQLGRDIAETSARKLFPGETAESIASKILDAMRFGTGAAQFAVPRPEAIGAASREQAGKIQAEAVKRLLSELPKMVRDAGGRLSFTDRGIETHDVGAQQIAQAITDRLNELTIQVTGDVKAEDDRRAMELAEQARKEQENTEQFIRRLESVGDLIATAVTDAFNSTFNPPESPLHQLARHGIRVGIDFVHTIIDKKKDRAHKGGIRRAARGDGIARHLPPKYQGYVLRSRAGVGVVEPLPENYHGSHILNGGT